MIQLTINLRKFFLQDLTKKISPRKGLCEILGYKVSNFRNNKKVAGVLVETGYRGEDLEWLILGIGINVNASQNDFPIELQDICTSIYAESNTFHDRNNLFAHFLNKLEEMLFNPPRKQ